MRSSLENYTSNNTRQHEYNTTQHETTWVQNNIKFILIDLFHRRILGAGILGSKALFILQNLENWKSLFPVTARIELGNWQRLFAIVLQFSVFLLIEIILIVSFFRFKTSYEKAFAWT